MRRPLSTAAQRGVSLVELMVALFLGLATVAALVIGYLATERSGRTLRALSQMTEDAQMALTLIARDVQAAGDADITGLQGSTFQVALTVDRIRGCSGSFANLAAAPNLAGCNAGGNHSIEITRQARLDTAFDSKLEVVSGASTYRVRDCGVGLVGLATTFSNRYFIDTPKKGDAPELYCASSLPSSSKLPLVANVEQLRLSYGIADAGSGGNHPVAYVGASAVNRWNDVVAVGICVLMRSAEPVLSAEDVQKYQDCDGQTVTSGNRHLYRSFWRTAAVRNRAGVLDVNAAAGGS